MEGVCYLKKRFGKGFRKGLSIIFRKWIWYFSLVAKLNFQFLVTTCYVMFTGAKVLTRIRVPSVYLELEHMYREEKI